MRRLAPLFLSVAVLSALGAVGVGAYSYHRAAQLAHPPAPKTAVVVTSPPAATPVPSETPAGASPAPSPTPLPPSFLIKVPYTPQAPGGNWDAAHEEYCEAAAVLMVGSYYGGDSRSVIPIPEADQAMARIVRYERQTWPAVLDLPLDKVGQVGSSLYGLEPVLSPATLDSVKAEVAQGHPVIVPVMTHGAPGGAKIAPFYGSQNVYHVIVITGYDGQYVYTNDAGFTQGQNWRYSWSTLETAMDAQEARMGQGRVMLSFHPRPSA